MIRKAPRTTRRIRIADKSRRYKGYAGLKYVRGRVVEASWGATHKGIPDTSKWMVLVTKDVPSMALRSSPFDVRVKGERHGGWKQLPKYVHDIERQLRKLLGKTPSQISKLPVAWHYLR